MKKWYKKTLFSKNRITLTVKNNINSEPCVYSVSGTLYGDLSNGDDRYKRTKCVNKIVTERFESPLGFYYYKKVTISEEVEDDKMFDPTISWYEIIMQSSKHSYELRFPASQGNISISVDTRPWNIVKGCKSLEDHFIIDLFNYLENIFSELEHDKAVVLTKSYVDYHKFVKSKQGLGEFRKNLYTKIFGNHKGPIYQTDSEKILAHGFDLKTSFRKDKEK